MNSNMAADQQGIVEWFDGVYQRKGKSYLRPPKAYLIFLELLGAQPQHKLLDVACGPGVLLGAARAYTSQLYGIDISAKAVTQALRDQCPADVRIGNAECLPYPDAHFDLITCLGSLERMLNVSRALLEMKRVGTPDARYCFLVRNSNRLRWKYLASIRARRRARSHAGADTLENWTALFESTGFEVHRVLPDQYPLHLRKQWASLFLSRIDYREPITPRKPIDRANEFVFLLGKVR